MDPVSLYALISMPFGWSALSKLQRGFIIFAAIDRYILMKLILSFCIGWIILPLYLLKCIFRMICWMFFDKEKKVSDNNTR